VTKYNKWQLRFIRRFNETKQESVPQKVTKHQQALLHVVLRAKSNINLQNGHNAQIKHSVRLVTSSFEQTGIVVQSCFFMKTWYVIMHVSVRIHSAISLDRTFQINATAPKHNVTCSQHHETHQTALLFRTVCVYSLIKRLDFSNSRYWLQAQCHSLTLIRNKWMLQR